MLAQFVIFVIKILIGTSLGLIGIYNTKRKKKMERIFDELTIELQNEIIIVCIRYAKGEIAELNLPPSTDVLELALQYDTMYFLEPIDFAGYDTLPVPAFCGSRPLKRPA